MTLNTTFCRAMTQGGSCFYSFGVLPPNLENGYSFNRATNTPRKQKHAWPAKTVRRMAAANDHGSICEQACARKPGNIGDNQMYNAKMVDLLGLL